MSRSLADDTDSGLVTPMKAPVRVKLTVPSSDVNF